MDNFENNHCESCGTIQAGPPIFAIGAKRDDEATRDIWCMVEGTGRYVCPACYPAEAERARRLFDAMVHKGTGDGR